MRSLSLLSLVLFTLAGAAGCAADTSAEPASEPEAIDASELNTGGITLRNGALRTLDKGPESVRVTASAGNVKAKVTQSSLARCVITRDAAASTAKKTVFAIGIDYDSDDGWNGCTIEFKAAGYKSSLDVGFTIGG
jgi:hypothetical protein